MLSPEGKYSSWKLQQIYILCVYGFHTELPFRFFFSYSSCFKFALEQFNLIKKIKFEKEE